MQLNASDIFLAWPIKIDNFRRKLLYSLYIESMHMHQAMHFIWFGHRQTNQAHFKYFKFKPMAKQHVNLISRTWSSDHLTISRDHTF